MIAYLFVFLCILHREVLLSQFVATAFEGAKAVLLLGRPIFTVSSVCALLLGLFLFFPRHRRYSRAAAKHDFPSRFSFRSFCFG